MQPSMLMTNYFMALSHGISDPTLRLAQCTAPWAETAATLLSVLDDCAMFQRARYYDRKALIISRRWLEDTTRVKRRLLTQGGRDNSFYKGVRSAIEDASNFDDEDDDLEFPFVDDTQAPSLESNHLDRHKSRLQGKARENSFSMEKDFILFFLDMPGASRRMISLFGT
jgi:hypothetical protein